MAIIGRIRNRVGLLIAIIGVSMALFILGDIFSSNQGLFAGTSDVVGEVGGEKVHYRDYEERVKTLITNYTNNQKGQAPDQSMQDMLRDQAWSMYVNENTLGKEYKKLGIECSNEELYELCTGPNANAQVKQAFTNPKTGQFDPNEVVKFLKDLTNRDEATQKQWADFEKYVREERIAEKYRNLIKGGLYVTTAEAKQDYIDKGRMASVRYVMLDYMEIPDSTVKVDDADLKKYYSEHQNEYKQAETVRKIEYVNFPIVPSDQDKADAAKWVNEKVDAFAGATDNVSFIAQYSDSPFDSAYYAKGTQRPAVDTLYNAAIGTLVGPYEDMGAIKISKLNAVKMVSDSAKARHILVKIQGTDTAAAMAKADSLKTLIKKSAKFADVATKNSEDFGSATKGGDLGWFQKNAMVKPFEDACFNGNKGDLVIVQSQFGIHLIEIQDKGVPSKQIQIATVEHKLQPSQKTYDDLFAVANKFAAENNTAALFDSAVVKRGLNKGIADNVKEADRRLPGIESPRELIRWAYGAKPNETSKVFTMGDKYVVAKLVSVKDKGILSLDDVKDQVTAGARRQKKAEMLLEKYNKMAAGSKTIDEVASKLQKPAQIAENISFGNSFNQSFGNDARAIATIFTLKPGAMSTAIQGDQGVYIIMLDKFTEPADMKEFKQQQAQLMNARKQTADGGVQNALKEKAEVEDNRGKFY